MPIAKVKTNETFDLTVNGVLLCGFKKEATWEGLHKLRSEDGDFVIVDKDPSHNVGLEVLRMSKELYEETQVGQAKPKTAEELGKFIGVFEPNYVHIKKRSEYQLLYVSNTLATKPDWGRQAVYTDGATIWTRPLFDFEERYKLKD